MHNPCNKKLIPSPPSTSMSYQLSSPTKPQESEREREKKNHPHSQTTNSQRPPHSLRRRPFTASLPHYIAENERAEPEISQARYTHEDTAAARAAAEVCARNGRAVKSRFAQQIICAGAKAWPRRARQVCADSDRSFFSPRLLPGAADFLGATDFGGFAYAYVRARKSCGIER